MFLSYFSYFLKENDLKNDKEKIIEELKEKDEKFNALQLEMNKMLEFMEKHVKYNVFMLFY